jgi:hypothetical protein
MQRKWTYRFHTKTSTRRFPRYPVRSMLLRYKSTKNGAKSLAPSNDEPSLPPPSPQSGSSRQQLLLRHWLANSISSSASNTCQLYCIPQRCIINKQQWSDSGWLIGLLSAVQHNSSYSISYGQEHQMYMYNAVREEQWQSLAQSRSLLHLHDRYQLVVPNLFGLGRRRRDHYLAALGICENECKGIGCRFCNSSYVRTHTHTHARKHIS